MRLRGILLAVLAAGTLSSAALAQPTVVLDRGKDRPPARYTEDAKSIWMTEWTACWHSSMGRMARILHIPIRSGQTPQQAAKKLASRAVYLLYETRPETLAALDGCRNGILWRYYHPQ